MRGANRLRRVAWRLSGRGRNAALVLMYHRVAELERDPWALAVSPANFQEHLQVLRASYDAIHAREIPSAMAEGRLAGSTVVVTFDDGYADNLEVARPLLERQEVKATFLVPTGMLGGGREFWWDELEHLLLAPDQAPPTLRCDVLGREWHLGDGEPLRSGAHRSWRSGRPAPTRRHQVYEELWRLLLHAPESRREAALAELRGAMGADGSPRPSHRLLTADDLVALAGDELAEIGSHAVSHTLLSALPVADQRREIEQSKACLEGLIGRPVQSFSYPNGGFDQITPHLAREAGYALALTTEFGLVTGSTDPFRLPRLMPPDVDGDRFARWLRRLLPSRRATRAA